jgi:hypothetical protein
MDEDERIPRPRGHEVGAHDGLPDTGRRHEDADVVLEERPRGLLLDRSQFALETEVKSLTLLTPIVNDQTAARTADTAT